MINFAVNQWDKNKQKLEENILNNLKDYEDCNYRYLVAKVIEFIFNDEESEFTGDDYDCEKITEINNGSYQGTLLYMIPEKGYQPSEYQYLMTYVNYGSCSGCDTLKALQRQVEDIFDEYSDYTPEAEAEKTAQAVKDIMSLCLHLVQNTIKPYNKGWAFDENFEEVK